jgi:hypothetical protein
MKKFIYKHKVIFSVIFAFLFIAVSVCSYFLYTYFSFQKQLKAEYILAWNAKTPQVITTENEQYYADQIESRGYDILKCLSISKRSFYFGSIDADKQKLNVKISSNLNIDFYRYNDKQNLIIYHYKNRSIKYLLTDDWGFWVIIKKVRD